MENMNTKTDNENDRNGRSTPATGSATELVEAALEYAALPQFLSDCTNEQEQALVRTVKMLARGMQGDEESGQDVALRVLAAEVRRLREVEIAAARLLEFVDDACSYAWFGPVGECPDDKLRVILKSHNDEAERRAWRRHAVGRKGDVRGSGKVRTEGRHGRSLQRLVILPSVAGRGVS